MALNDQQFQTLVKTLQERKKLATKESSKPLSGDAAKVSAIATTIESDIAPLKEAFSENYRGSLVGIVSGTNRKLVKLVDNAADKVGRLRSGGAINKDEEARFKRQIASFMDIPFGKEQDAIDALDGILEEARQVSQSIKPSTSPNISPELQQLINQRKQVLGISTGDSSETPMITEKPQKPLTEKLLGVSRALQLGGRAGETIGEAIGTVIARSRATPEERQFIEAGPTGKEIAKDVGNIAINLFGAGILGKLGIAGKVASKTGAGKLAQSLEEANLRLTPVQKQNIGNRLKTITDYTSKLSGTPEQRLNKARSAVEADEGLFQRFINIEAKGKTISKKNFINDLNNIKNQYANDRDILDIERQIDNAVKVAQRFPKQIPVNALNQFKRSTFKNAFSRAGDKVSDAIEYEIGDVAKNHIEQALKGLKINGKDLASFNREYGNKIAAEKLLKTASTRAEIGFTGKILGGLTGGLIGSAIGGPVGGAAGVGLSTTIGKQVAGTRARAAVGRLLGRIAK